MGYFYCGSGTRFSKTTLGRHADRVKGTRSAHGVLADAFRREWYRQTKKRIAEFKVTFEFLGLLIDGWTEQAIEEYFWRNGNPPKGEA